MRQWIARQRAALAELPIAQLPLLLPVGLVLGVFPIAGIPTVLCLLAASILRLNAPALQVLNSVTSPLQLVLLLPLARAGYWLCGEAMSTSGSWTAQAGSAALHAIAGWACICVPLGALLYAGLSFAMRVHQWPQINAGERR